MDLRKISPVVRVVILTVGLATAVTACGSSKNSSATGNVGNRGDGVKAAKAALEPFTKANSKDLGITVPLTGKPPTGKLVYAFSNSNPLAGEIDNGLKAAAEALGWQFRLQTWSTNPSDANGFIRQAVQAKADYIYVSAASDSLIASAVAEAKAANIPIFNGANTTPPKGKDNWFFSNINGVDKFIQGGQVAANQVTVASDGKANVLNVDIPAVPVQQAQTDAFSAELKKNCPQCTYSHLGITLADNLSGAAARLTLSYLRTHKNIDTIVFGAGPMTTGFASIAKQAGFKLGSKGISVNVINTAQTNLTQIRNGEVDAAVSEGLPWLGWQAADAMARYSLNMDLSPNWNVIVPQLVQTKDNVKSGTDEYTGPVDYAASFKKLWQLS